ncbi:AraC family transcriptional regulator [Rhodococcus sp. BP-252]|uniref:AraC family transcriptional regulator n=1 Tax=unclassified Rhodococcus (in: high G+C Gram-positive bacteria) TaxID=192944 RepID=UPI001C9BADD0|nr:MULTISPECIES: helix-turn-helix domain-containing protein [unclassified Rhodococcus (in: high G+C Gram-positive bacteria)]MBY6411703.1 AraC family transcriptional regulator [Rhodococcus sp. BP-320]MBY6417312.1 AraC family transcriptional regulator [Rhodococcus sp. BP-321]MBY6421903.1 AraC family transcriptional regulator [Rhodococcus sp. BP-324]MBY6427336.1 AraC family transcriptional regulator [Rhodococcus sp. BP-323]MBY6432521.1 AraC family transcriptional regulator [Rhodococcus sp. BP-322
MLERWNDALAYIEDNLAGEIDPEKLARITLTSEYHVRRVFSALAGMSLTQYIRARRMTLATADILSGDGILDVAVRYGYSSSDAFGRAFRQMNGMTPSQARRPGAVLRSQQALSFHLTIEGRSTMRYRIVDLPEFHIVGRKTRIPLVYSGPNTAMTEFHRTLPEGTGARLKACADVEELPEILFVSTAFESDRADGSLFDYYFAVASATNHDDWDSLAVPASKWVVFEAHSENDFQLALQQLWADAFGEWFPSNPYEVVPGPEILTVTQSSDDWTSGTGELWIPVKRSS